MANNLIARGQVSIVTQKDAYTITQSIGQYIFATNDQGVIPREITLVSQVTVMCGDDPIPNFTIGSIVMPVGFSAITANNLQRTITYKVAAGTANLADDGCVAVPILIGEQEYTLTFSWAKSRQGVPGATGSLLDWVADWDTGKTQINGTAVITPKIYAGVKNADGTLTGSAIGHFTVTQVNDKGAIITETIDGIYGFRNGKKTFALDSTGSVVLGRGDQSIAYDAVNGKIIFGAGVSLTWTNAISTAKNEAISSAASTAQSKADAALGSAKTYADTKKTEAIDSATATAQSKADAALGSAKTYADVKKTEAIDSAATTAQNKADAALGTAKSYADTKKTEAVTDAGKAADAKITTLTTTLNTSIAEAKKAGTDARAVADAITSKAANEGWSGKLTYIDANGIFTGTLSANTVNAVRINASQITAGTISTERLDAATIRTNIINANYINGLSCTFVQGKIGGWTIGPSTLSADHIVLDTANKRLAVFGASSNQVSGQRVQMYYNNDSDFGIYATDSSGGCVFQLGAVNKIAGWGITTTTITKGGVSLGADGSISNGAKWKLGNDGSGQLASGNIVWDAAGNVTFGASVSLQWNNAANNAATNALNSAKTYADSKKSEAISAAAADATSKTDAAKELAQAMAFGKMLNRDPTFFNGANGINTYNNAGTTTVTITRKSESTAPTDSQQVLEIRNTGSASPGLGGFFFGTNCWYRKVFITRIIAKIPVGWTLAFATNNIGTGGISKWLTPNIGTGDWCEYVYKVTCGTTGFGSTNYYYLLGALGTPAVPVVWQLAYATVFDVASNEKYTTTIDANGIYTGTLTAAQVNAVTINAGSITTGLLSADRIAAGSINASKLDAASIKASIINTDYINGLSCSFVRGTIGGWTINGDSIYAGSIGALGATPIQLRPVSTGSGYWFTGSYKPLGACLTWYRDSNAGHIVFGQVAASGSAPRAGFIGIQMMAWDNTEYFCLSANTTCSGYKEVYNRIAGWAFDSSQISKNNVSLGADGSITNASRWRLNNDGSANFSSGRVQFYNDGSGYVANGNLRWDAAGNLTAVGGNFKDVTIQGTIRSAFVFNDSSIWVDWGGGSSSGVQTDPVHYDNVVCTQTGGWNEYINLLWTLNQSGRRICLVNYRWGSTISTGYMTISAPSGKYFYENGIAKSTLSFSREVVELLGYGDNITFFGWIVLNRRDMMCDGKYGSFQQVLAQGTVTTYSGNNSASIKYKTFDGSTMSVNKTSAGWFYIYMPWSLGADKYMVMLTGVTASFHVTPIYASVRNQYSSYFQVSTQDDSSQNDGSFNFQIISTADFK